MRNWRKINGVLTLRVPGAGRLEWRPKLKVYDIIDDTPLRPWLGQWPRKIGRTDDLLLAAATLLRGPTT